MLSEETIKTALDVLLPKHRECRILNDGWRAWRIEEAITELRMELARVCDANETSPASQTKSQAQE